MTRRRPGHRKTLTAAEVRAMARPFRFDPLPDDGSLKIVSPGLSRVTAAKEKAR